MDKIYDYIFRHRKGVMGTLIFHLIILIVLFSFKLSDVSLHKEKDFQIELKEPELLQNINKLKQNIEENREKNYELSMRRAIISNENAKNTKPKKLDISKLVSEIKHDIDKSPNHKKYSIKKDENYQTDSIKFLKDRINLDSLKSTFYSGESSVSYNLIGRYALKMPIPVFQCYNGGKVVVNIIVNRSGKVINAEVVKSKSTNEESLCEAALNAAYRAFFNSKNTEVQKQEGTITYNFVNQ